MLDASWGRIALAAVLIGSPQGILAQPRTLVATIEFEAGGLGSDLFGQISGIDLHSSGGVAVADRMHHKIYWVDADGGLIRTMGRQGSGPGDLEAPCCIRFAGDTLWVLSPNSRRMDSFLVNSGTPRWLSRRSVRANARVVYQWPLSLLTNGNLVVWVGRSTPAAPDVGSSAGLEIDSGSNTVAEHLVEGFPPDSFGNAVIRRPDGRRMAVPIPFSGRLAVAQRGDGSYASTLTTRYAIEVYSLDGQLRGVIRRPDVTGTPLDREERSRVSSTITRLRNEVDRNGGELLHAAVPDAKPVVHSMWYDADGRLWVRRGKTTAEGYAHADVYLPSGALSFIAEWPASIDLSTGAIHDAVAWGVRRGEYDEHYLVRLRFTERDN